MMKREEKKFDIRKNLKRIWDYQWKPERKGVRQKAVRILAGYLILMVVLTVVSRSLKGMTMPVVTISTAASSTIDQVTEAEGKLEYDSERPVYLEAGLKIEEVLVREGQSVEEGDTLIRIQMEDLREQIRLKKEEVRVRKAEYEALVKNQSEQDYKQQQEILRAEQDYEIVRQQTDFEVSRAEEARNEAWNRYSEALSNAPETAEAQRISYEQAQKEYEDTLWSRENQILTAQRNLEDAKAESGEGAGGAAAKLEWETQKEELQSLKQIRKAGGKIPAPYAGIVSAVYAGEGQITQESASLLIADRQGGLSFTAKLPSEELAKLNGEENLSVLLGAEETEFTDLNIASSSQDTEQEGQTQVRIVMPKEAADAGTYGTLKITSSSRMYDAVVPLEALHQGEAADSYYVYLVREEEGILGKQWKVQPLEVRIAEKNEYQAALTTKELTYGQEIVVGTDKPLEAGDAVRLAEE